MKDRVNSPIGFLDSGVGGITVLNEALKVLPCENYIYFGDSKNAPYGIKTLEEVRALTEKNVEFLLNNGAKAVVIACNTATSVAADYLRKKYGEAIPIVGVEPALKPAALAHEGGKILVMATPVTLAEKRFQKMLSRYEENAEIVPVPCPGLMEFIENGKLDGEELMGFLRSLLPKKMCEHTSAVVLGCTHYPFIADQIAEVIGGSIEIYNGANGAARQLKRRLLKQGLLNPLGKRGEVELLNSSDNQELLELSKRLVDKK